MTTVQLGFKAFDPHELLSHFIAQESSLYQQAGLRIELLDTTVLPQHQLPEIFFSVACGAALTGWLQGEANKVLLVNTDKPMFWLYQRDNSQHCQNLAGKRIASYPGMAPPAMFLNQILADKQLNTQQLPCANDNSRLGLLRSGDADAALISSAIPPAQMAQYGFTQGLLLGDQLRVASTGLATHHALIQREPELVKTLLYCHQQALRLIHHDDELLAWVLEKNFLFGNTISTKSIRLIRDCYSHDGRSSDTITQPAVNALAKKLQQKVPREALYDFTLLS